MSKEIVLAFDDGRKDQMTNAVRIIKKYNLTGTIYITTGFVDGSLKDTSMFPSSGGEAMSIDDVRECLKNGIEIGAHSDKHTNAIEDILASIDKLTEWNKDIVGEDYLYGFGSPSSDIYSNNIASIESIRNKMKYVRTSVQVRRNGLIYTGLYVLNKLIKSKKLFFRLNKKYTWNKPGSVIESVPIRSNTSLSHIIYLLENMEERVCVLLFHGILTEKEENKKLDCWYYDADKFEELCKYLSSHKYSVRTLREILDN